MSRCAAFAAVVSWCISTSVEEDRMLALWGAVCAQDPRYHRGSSRRPLLPIRTTGSESDSIPASNRIRGRPLVSAVLGYIAPCCGHSVGKRRMGVGNGSSILEVLPSRTVPDELVPSRSCHNAALRTEVPGLCTPSDFGKQLNAVRPSASTIFGSAPRCNSAVTVEIILQ